MIARVLSETVTEEKIRDLVQNAFNLMQGQYVSEGACTGCGKARKVHVLVPDLKNTVSVLTEWMEQGFGRPGTAGAESGDVNIIIERIWPSDGLEDFDVVPDAPSPEAVSPEPGEDQGLWRSDGGREVESAL